MKDKNLRKYLGIKDIFYSDCDGQWIVHTDSIGWIDKLQTRIYELEDKIKALETLLDIKYQYSCTEQLPKYVKTRKRK